MGCMSSSPATADPKIQSTNNQIDKNVRKRAEEEAKVRKLLLLGTGESGKSTVFRQMIKLFGKGFSQMDREHFKTPIRENVIEGIHKLLEVAKKEEISLKAENEDAAKYIEGKFEYLSQYPQLSKETADVIVKLWSDPALKEAYGRRAKGQVFDSCSYFLDKVHEVAEEKYLPSDEDLLKVRVRTTGILQEEFDVKGLKLRMIDVGGQRNERRKWIHSFEDVTSVIYVTAVSEYDQKCFEDEETNRMEESLKIFGETMNSNWFERTSVILFLNKRDLFEDKFSRVPLKDYFPAFEGSTAQDGFEFFTGLFCQRIRPGRDVYAHIVTATDSDNILHVFSDVRHIIVKDLLGPQGSGFL
jgi:GTPase SAR1 family protein